MSRFNTYARQADDAAQAAFKKYRAAEAKYKAAQDKEASFPKNFNGVMPQYKADHARAQAELYDAKDEYDEARRELEACGKTLAGIRAELEAAIDKAYAADPEKIDSNTLELMKSGILSGKEYARLLEKAQADDNKTMARIIGSYAREAAAKVADKNGTADPEATLLRTIANEANTDNGSEYMQAFDTIADVYNRCTKNSALIDKWGDLTGDIVAEF